ncbi:TMhelix containing protein [Vibrio phage 1.029.O._10N.261.55.A7]|nr:TMhelix containing protein [Vibrio phage 1.029.O._10N.261.55.A7]
MEWLKKIAGYAPDIVGAIVSGGATLPATAMRIISKELTGVETDNPDLVEKAVNNASSEDLLKLKQANNDFIVKKLEMQAAEMQSARSAYVSSGGNQADKIADRVMKYNIIYAVVIALAQIFALTYFTDLPDTVIVIIGNVCGWIIKGVLDERKDVTGFYFGSSLGSKQKDAK